jgi:Fe2+ or Zn2+ uptake regulation protein
MSDRFLQALKSKRLRLTQARREVFRVLEESERALSVQEVFQQIEETSDVSTDKVSVYRNLSLFSELGLVHRFQDGRHALCTHDHHDHDHKHLHIVANCNRCGITFEVGSHNKEICQSVNKMKSLIHNFEQLEGVTFQGVCKRCR